MNCGVKQEEEKEEEDEEEGGKRKRKRKELIRHGLSAQWTEDEPFITPESPGSCGKIPVVVHY